MQLEASDARVETMVKSPDAEGRTVTHEAIYRWIYALPKGELGRSGILLQSKRISRKRRKPLGERAGGRIIGMVSIDDRTDSASDRRGLVMGGRSGHRQGRQIRFRDAGGALQQIPGHAGPAQRQKGRPPGDVLINRVHDLSALMRGSLTWDQGTEMADHTELTVATELPVYFAHPHSP